MKYLHALRPCCPWRISTDTSAYISADVSAHASADAAADVSADISADVSAYPFLYMYICIQQVGVMTWPALRLCELGVDW